jgi:hypothetical protein
MPGRAMSARPPRRPAERGPADASGPKRRPSHREGQVCNARPPLRQSSPRERNVSGFAAQGVGPRLARFHVGRNHSRWRSREEPERAICVRARKNDSAPFRLTRPRGACGPLGDQSWTLVGPPHNLSAVEVGGTAAVATEISVFRKRSRSQPPPSTLTRDIFIVVRCHVAYGSDRCGSVSVL